MQGSLAHEGGENQISDQKTIDITPDFGRLFKSFLAEAKNQARGEELFNLLKEEDRAEALREARGFLAPLAVAAGCMTTPGQVEEFRAVLSQIVTEIHETENEINKELEGAMEEL